MSVLVILTTQSISVKAQHYTYINNETNLRIEKKYFSDSNLHTAIRPFIITDIYNLDSLETSLSKKERNNFISKLLNDNMINWRSEKTSVYLNPVFTILPSYELNSKNIFVNSQFGISLGASIGQKLAFRIDATYGIQSFDELSEGFVDSTGIVPHFGSYLVKKNGNYHYFDINGYVSYSPWKYLNLQTGIGRNFLGEGHRSLFLSDNSNSYPFFKATANIWKFKYIWMFGSLKDPNSSLDAKSLKNKLLFIHYLSWNATKWLNINFFESIVSSPVDSVGVNYFNFNYLNPVIFFRPVEFSGGSADNALLGFGFKLKILKQYQFYSQFLIDEFVFAEMKSGKNWWGNKFGVQAGIKVFNLLNIDNLFGRIEYNFVRPYTYSYSNNILNYGTHFQPLAHPFGANFEELIFQIHYHKNRYSFQAKAVFSKAGMDTDSVSFGKDIYKSYELRQDDYGNVLGQGFQGVYSNVELKSGWLLNRKINLQILFSINYQKTFTPYHNLEQMFLSIGIVSLIHNNGVDLF